MVAQELNIIMKNPEDIRDLIMGYEKDSHHDFFTSNAVFRDIWLRISEASTGDIKPHQSKKKKSSGQGGGSGVGARERDDDTPFNQHNFEQLKTAINGGNTIYYFANVIIGALDGGEEELKSIINGIISRYEEKFRYFENIMENPELDEDTLNDSDKIELTLMFYSIFGRVETDFALGYITEDDLYEEPEPEPGPGYLPEIDLPDLISELIE